MGDREVDQDQGNYNYKSKKILKRISIYGEEILITKGLASFFLQ